MTDTTDESNMIGQPESVTIATQCSESMIYLLTNSRFQRILNVLIAKQHRPVDNKRLPRVRLRSFL